MERYRFAFALAVLWMAALVPAWAGADAIDQIVLSEMKRQFSPAVGLAVVKNGRVVKVKGYGLANVEWQARATPDTVFESGSVGKQFTAALVMLLVRDGKLKLDDPIAQHLSDTPAAWQGITVRQLLTHTSGLDRTDPANDFWQEYTEEERLASAYKVPLLSRPGERHSYSNLGYHVLGILCSRVGGHFWGDQLRERVFVPLGMRTARVISQRDIVMHRAAGYDRLDGQLTNQPWVAPTQNTTADGGLFLSAQDMARWSLALADERLFTKAEKQAMWTPAVLNDAQPVNYGFGWELSSDASHRMVRHGGAWQHFTTHIAHLPEDGITVSVLMNRARGQPHVVVDKILAHYLPELRQPPAPPQSFAAVAKTPIFLRGSMNDWATTTPLVAVAPGLLSATLTLAAGVQRFKVGDADWKVVDLGASFDETVALGKTMTLEFRGEDLQMAVGTAGKFTFEVDLRDARAARLKVVAIPARQD